MILIQCADTKKFGMTNKDAGMSFSRAGRHTEPGSGNDENAEELWRILLRAFECVKDAGTRRRDESSPSAGTQTKAAERPKPYQVKRVLEDDFGFSFLFSEMTGKRAPQLEGWGLTGAFGKIPC